MPTSKDETQDTSDSRHEPTAERLERRRHFLTRSSVVLGAMAIAGSKASSAEAHESGGRLGLSEAQAAALDQIMDEAVCTGDIKRSLAKFSRAVSLPEQVIAELGQLTEEDLAAAKRLSDKLPTVELAGRLSTNNGIIGM